MPYLVVAGSPKSRLMDLVCHPKEFLEKRGQFRIHSIYYITKQIVPTLARIFNLVGVDITQWFREMPKSIKEFRPQVGKNTKTLLIQPVLFMGETWVQLMNVENIEGRNVGHKNSTICCSTTFKGSLVLQGLPLAR